MDSCKAELDREYINKCMVLQGYSPKLNCPRCGGFGWVHPMLSGGKLEYSKVVSCDAPGCLAESYRNKSL